MLTTLGRGMAPTKRRAAATINALSTHDIDFTTGTVKGGNVTLNTDGNAAPATDLFRYGAVRYTSSYVENTDGSVSSRVATCMRSNNRGLWIDRGLRFRQCRRLGVGRRVRFVCRLAGSGGRGAAERRIGGLRKRSRIHLFLGQFHLVRSQRDPVRQYRRRRQCECDRNAGRDGNVEPGRPERGQYRHNGHTGRQRPVVSGRRGRGEYRFHNSRHRRDDDRSPAAATRFWAALPCSCRRRPAPSPPTCRRPSAPPMPSACAKGWAVPVSSPTMR